MLHVVFHKTKILSRQQEDSLICWVIGEYERSRSRLPSKHKKTTYNQIIFTCIR